MLNVDLPPDIPQRPTGREPAVSQTIPPQEPGRHGCVELLKLVGDVRRLTFDRSLDDADRSRRIRDTFREYDGEFATSEGTLSQPDDATTNTEKQYLVHALCRQG